LLVCSQEERSLVRETGQELDDLGFAFAEVHHGRIGRGEVRSSDPEAVELMQNPILNHTKPGELVYEPFLGSGATLAAAEMTQRVCYGLDLDPKYADVVVGRWQGLTGRKATLEGDGRTFDAVSRDRVKIAA
jgi:DNA modification methylase